MGIAERGGAAPLRTAAARAAGLRWLGAGALALGLHAGAALLLIRDARPEPLDAGGGDAITLELDPVEGEAAKPDDARPAAPADEASEAAAAAAAAQASRATARPTVEAPPTPPAPPPEAPPPEPPSPEPPPPEPPPPPSEAAPAAPALPSPAPPVTTPAPAPEPTRPETPPAQASAASAASAPSAAAEDAAPAVQRLSPARVAAWRGKLVPHLNRFRRPLLGVGEGTVRVGFTLDAEGRVTAVSTATSSGDAALDDAARELIRRASPFPRPPPGLSGPALSFVVPIHNGRRP